MLYYSYIETSKVYYKWQAGDRMKTLFRSAALEANLAQTKREGISFTEEQEWFLSLSGSYWGVKSRTKEFFEEFNHPYANYKSLLKSLHDVCLTDLWLYRSLTEAEEAFIFIAKLFEELMDRNLESRWFEELIKIVFKFSAAIAEEKTVPKEPLCICLDLINKGIGSEEEIMVRHSSLFRTYLAKIAQRDDLREQVNTMTKDVLLKSCRYWQHSTGVEAWFENNKTLFSSPGEDKLKIIGAVFFSELERRIQKASNWEELSACLFFNDIAAHFRRFCKEFDRPVEKVYYLIYLIHVPGMASLQNHLLYDMNKQLERAMTSITGEEVFGFIDNLFSLFHGLKPEFTGTILGCQNTIGKEIAKTENPELISYYIKKLIAFGFIYPGEIRINEDWQTLVNREHVKNIRMWLDLICNSPSQYKELLTALIANLKLGGIFVSDTDLLQRDITKLLNADIGPVYKQVKQLARIFPVYFQEIGAEGKLRDVTTAIDELGKRKDRLSHFLRKQVHSESNNTHIRLVEKIAAFWEHGDKEILSSYIPKDVEDSLDIKDPLQLEMHELMMSACRYFSADSQSILKVNYDSLAGFLDKKAGGKKRGKKKLLYLQELYQLLREKYSFEEKDISRAIKENTFFKNEDAERFEKLMEEGGTSEALLLVYGWMKRLKEIMLDPKKTEPSESIYYKRHIAIGIPSMYGRYCEPKFEALGMMYRLERVASRLMEKMLSDFHLDYLTAKTMSDAYQVLQHFSEGLSLDGIENQSFQSNLEMLRYCLNSPSFTLDQFIDIFKFMAQSVREIINEYFLRVYDETLTVVVPQIFPQKEEHLKITESYYRNILSSAFLVQDLDQFITTLINRLVDFAENYSSQMINDMLTFNHDKLISSFDVPSPDVDNQVYMGTKAFYLKRIKEFGFPVPEGFVITTELFRHRRSAFNHQEMKRRIREDVSKEVRSLEEKTGLKYGDAGSPLLLSVRSGTAISMPGAMSTFLNVGINEMIANALSRDPQTAWMAWDSYRRFLQSWGMASGVLRDDFDAIMISFKDKYHVQQKKNFSWQQMRQIAHAYREHIRGKGIMVEENPMEQLMQAINSVLDSWNTKRAYSYRKHLRVADEWGTAVIVQRMVMGNCSDKAGSGVFFTHNPKLSRPGIHPYGDFTLCSQGEDIVSGLVHPLPISKSQREEDYAECNTSLEEAFPGIYQSLLNYARQLIEDYEFNNQEIEFTFESADPKDLYILQVRDQNIQKQSKTGVFTNQPSLQNLLGRGIGIHGACLSGRVIFCEDDFLRYRNVILKTPLILIRPDTVPDDIPLIFQCDGLLTSRGGVTSHAAVTASKLGKVCIVNCHDLMVDENRKEAKIQGITLRSGDYLSIDGRNGSIYRGWNSIKEVGEGTF